VLFINRRNFPPAYHDEKQRAIISLLEHASYDLICVEEDGTDEGLSPPVIKPTNKPLS